MTESPERDRALSVLVALAESSSFSVSITLTTVGGVVTGTLVSGAEWARLNIETLKATGADHTGLASFYETFAEKFTREAAETAAVQDAVSAIDLPDDYRSAIGAVSIPSFIHLRDARVVSGAGLLPTGAAAPWRGRLSDIAGWALGELRAS